MTVLTMVATYLVIGLLYGLKAVKDFKQIAGTKHLWIAAMGIMILAMAWPVFVALSYYHKYGHQA